MKKDDLISRSGLLKEMQISGRAAYMIVQEAPAVDAEPVRHGRWIISSDGYYPYCSECKAEPKSGVMTKYCPNCGAKMDKEADK